MKGYKLPIKLIFRYYKLQKHCAPPPKLMGLKGLTGRTSGILHSLHFITPSGI